MKIICCPIAGKSLIVQFDPAASSSLEEHATRRPDPISHGLLLGSRSGDDPKCLHIHHVQPVFGGGEVPEASPIPNSTAPLSTLGYYTVRTSVDNLDQADREFLAESLPASACLAMVVTGKPDRRMLAQFYLRDGAGLFGPTPDHRQVLVAREEGAIQEEAPHELAPRMPPALPVKLWGRIGTAAGLIIAALILARAWNSRPPGHEYRPRIERASQPDIAPGTATTRQPDPAPVVRKDSEPEFRNASVTLLKPPGFVLPVQSVRKIQDPPEVAIWYPEPTSATARSTPFAAAGANHLILVHPIVNRESSR